VCKLFVIDLGHAALFFFSAGSPFYMILCDICGDFSVILKCYERLKNLRSIGCVLSTSVSQLWLKCKYHKKRGCKLVAQSVVVFVLWCS
jgi:hypothetical protein